VVMRVLVTGSSSGLAKAIVAILGARMEVFPFGKTDCDIRDMDGLKRIFAHISPQVCIHLAAVTDIDLCESEPELARAVNVGGTENIVKLCEGFKARLIFASSPFVFDGTKVSEYIEQDLPSPLNVYGKTKLEAEKVIQGSGVPFLILRPGWLFGPYVPRFSAKLVGSVLAGQTLRLATDTIFTPLYTIDCAHFILRAITENLEGVLHIGNYGSCSAYEFGCAVADLAGREKPLPARFEELNLKTPRPRNFSIRSETGLALRDWKEALACFLDAVSENPLFLCA